MKKKKIISLSILWQYNEKDMIRQKRVGDKSVMAGTHNNHPKIHRSIYRNIKVGSIEKRSSEIVIAVISLLKIISVIKRYDYVVVSLIKWNVNKEEKKNIIQHNLKINCSRKWRLKNVIIINRK